LIVGCFHTDVPNDFLDQDLTGRIGGRDWQYKYAFIDPTIDTPEDNDLVFVFLSYKPKDPCPRDSTGAGDRRSVMVSAPQQTKRTIALKRGTHRSLVFQYKAGPKQVANVAKKGRIKLTSISSDTIKGKVWAQLNDGNWVSGRFKAAVCDYEAFQ